MAEYVFKPSTPTHQVFSSSPFKPLSLSHHPWVRSSRRHSSIDEGRERPRLSLMTQYLFLNGPDSIPLHSMRAEQDNDVVLGLDPQEGPSRPRSPDDSPSSSLAHESSSPRMGTLAPVLSSCSDDESDMLQADRVWESDQVSNPPSETVESPSSSNALGLAEFGGAFVASIPPEDFFGCSHPGDRSKHCFQTHISNRQALKWSQKCHR